MRKFATAVLAITSLLCAGPAALAASSAIWTQAGAATFYRGELDKLSLTSEGALTLGFNYNKTLDTAEPYIWSVAADGAGNVYAGSGNKSALFKIGPKGETEQVAMFSGVGITALAIDKQDNVYAGTFPNGEIRLVDAKGAQKTLAALPSQYIWALKIDKDGDILAAGGAPAAIYKVTPKGEITTLMRSAERHILCMDVDENGTIYAGSSPNGLIYKVSAAHKKLSVVYDLPEEEAYRLLHIGGGKLLVAANRDQAPQFPGPDAGGPGGPQGGPQQQNFNNTPLSFPIPYNTPPPQMRAVPSAIYSIDATGEARKQFTFADPFIFSLLKLDDKHFLVGTGNHGNIYNIDISTLDSTLTQLPAKQILAISPGKGDIRYFATGNPGAVYTFTTAHNATGTFTSTVNDTFSSSLWGHLWTEAVVPKDTHVEFRTRTGNTSDPDDETWSGWSAAEKTLPAQITSPPARYIQYSASLYASNTAASPSVREVNIGYVTANQTPQINDLSVSPQPAKRQPPQDMSTGQPPVQQRGPRSFGMPAAQSPDAPPETNIQVGSLTANGEISIKWAALDPDGDSLKYTLFFRRITDTRWNSLSLEFFGADYRWQTESVPDGKYEIKLIASDIPSNPPTWARMESKVSDPFIIDNSRPAVTASVEQTGRGGVIRGKGEASDPTSIISAIDYSIDDLKWNAIFPDDRVFDMQSETFSFSAAGLAEGPHTLIVRARDFVGNTSSYSTTFSVTVKK